MAEFSAGALLAIAKKRFGEDVLRNRMRGSVAAHDDQDRELRRIALSVLGRVEAAVTPSVGWPIPGSWPSGTFDENDDDLFGIPYRDLWPYDLLQHALELFNWRTLSGMEEVSDQARRIGVAAERYFDELQKGIIGLGAVGILDVVGSETLVARNRDGSSNIGNVPGVQNTLDVFSYGGWDWVAGPGGWVS